jgi:hypothetical protein
MMPESSKISNRERGARARVVTRRISWLRGALLVSSALAFVVLPLATARAGVFSSALSFAGNGNVAIAHPAVDTALTSTAAELAWRDGWVTSRAFDSQLSDGVRKSLKRASSAMAGGDVCRMPSSFPLAAA